MRELSVAFAGSIVVTRRYSSTVTVQYRVRFLFLLVLKNRNDSRLLCCVLADVSCVTNEFVTKVEGEGTKVSGVSTSEKSPFSNSSGLVMPVWKVVLMVFSKRPCACHRKGEENDEEEDHKVNGVIDGVILARVRDSALRLSAGSRLLTARNTTARRR